MKISFIKDNEANLNEFMSSILYKPKIVDDKKTLVGDKRTSAITKIVRESYFKFKSEVPMSNIKSLKRTALKSYIKSEYLLYIACDLLYSDGDIDELTFNSMEIFYDIRFSTIPTLYHRIYKNKIMSHTPDRKKIMDKTSVVNASEMNINLPIVNGISTRAVKFYENIQGDKSLIEIVKNEFSHLFFVQIIGDNITNLKRNEKIKSFGDYKHYFYK